MEVVNDAEQEKILSNLDEDVEFEEFDAEEWSEDEKDKEDLNLWEEDWDDDDLEDDFSSQLSSTKFKMNDSQIPSLIDEDSLNEKIESTVALLWREHPNFEGLDFSSSISAISNSECNPPESSKSVSKDANDVSNSTEEKISLIEDLRNKLWHSRSEIAVALDAVILLLETSSNNQASVSNNSESSNSLGSGLLTMDTIINEKPSDQEKAYQLLISLGQKQKQLETSSEYLSAQSTRLRNIIILYGHPGTVNIDMGSQDFSDNNNPLVSTLPPQKKFFTSNTKLPISSLSTHLIGKKNNGHHKSVSINLSSLQSNDTSLTDKIQFINNQLIKARESSYSKELFKRIQHEALYFSKGSLSTINDFRPPNPDPSELSDSIDALNENPNSTTDVLNIPLSLPGYNLNLQYRISKSLVSPEDPSKIIPDNQKEINFNVSTTYESLPSYLRIVPDLTMILSYKYMIKQYQYENLKRIGTLSTLGPVPRNLLPVIESLKFLFLSNQIDSFLVRLNVFWKRATHSRIFLNSVYIGINKNEMPDVYYSTSFVFGTSNITIPNPIDGINIQGVDNNVGPTQEIKSHVSDKFVYNPASGLTNGTFIFNNSILVNTSFSLDINNNLETYDFEDERRKDLEDPESFDDKEKHLEDPGDSSCEQNSELAMDIDLENYSVTKKEDTDFLNDEGNRKHKNHNEMEKYLQSIKISFQLVIFEKINSYDESQTDVIKIYDENKVFKVPFQFVRNKYTTKIYRFEDDIVKSLPMESFMYEGDGTFSDYVFRCIILNAIHK
ncbi:hypothetical protein AYI68_g5468 [Smittium mucronatum]|uniref:Multifunctional fusion protein n=1 Tax=Smittium mucronatum TaxID=133383 RepID=A0A1R0GU59_9FUNG|nr:hypothetical protein AYI68_g5468 [Smittium mucronatum]